MRASAMTGDVDEGRALRRIVVGVVLSLIVHALLLAVWRSGGDEHRAPATQPLTIRLQAPPQQVETLVQTPPAPPRTDTRTDTITRKPARSTRTKPPRSVIAVAPDEQAPAAPDAFVVDQAPEAPPTEAPHFDPEAARKMARSLAHIRDPAKEGTAIGQFPEKPLETETRAARAIGAAKRRDCKDGLPGGLLGPLLILADKKDSGCKW